MRSITLPLLLALSACGAAPSASSPFEVLTPDGGALRAAFNAAVGKPRALLLASPT